MLTALEASKILIESTSVILLLHGVMGYNFISNKNNHFNILLGFLSIIIMSIITTKTLLGISPIILWISISIFPLFLFGFKLLNTITATVLFLDSLETTFQGIIIWIKGETYFNNIFSISILSSLFAFAVSLLILIIIKHINNAHRSFFTNFSQTFYFIITCIFFSMTFTFSWSNPSTPNYIFTQGAQLLVNGLSRCLFAIITILCMAFYYQKKQLSEQLYLNQKCINEQTKQYILLSDALKNIRKFRHDNNAHLTTIQFLSKEYGCQKVYTYITELLESQESTKCLTTGHIIGDAIINRYYNICKKSNIKITFMGHFSPNINIKESDLCIIINNLISNAYEACLKCKNKFIKIEITEYQSTQFIRISNPSPQNTFIKDGKIEVLKNSKTDKNNHGYGLSNIEDAVYRSNGSIQWYKLVTADNEIIVAEVLLNISSIETRDFEKI